MRNSVGLWAATAALAGLLFGFDTAVISGAEQAVQREWGMGPALHGLAISSALWGTVLGALFGGVPSDRLGRKTTLFWIGVLYLVSAVGSALAFDPASFIVFRFIGGVGVGASSVAAPAYIAEIAPAKSRGRLVALYQFMIVAGILVAFASNFALGGAGSAAWRWMLGVEALPALAYLVLTRIIPESPRWLMLQGRADEARAVISRSGGAATLGAEGAHGKGVSMRDFFSGRYAAPIMLAFLIAFFNQVSGINAIIYYAPRIFAQAGADFDAALLATVGIGVVNLAFTLVGLALIDRLGRRTLILIGSIGYIASLSMVGYGFMSGQLSLVAPFIFAFIAAHAIGQGAVIWVYISEIFPTEARAAGQSFGASTHWVLAAALTLVMPAVLARVAPEMIFFAFAGMMALQLAFALFLMAETKGRTLEEIAAQLSRR